MRQAGPERTGHPIFGPRHPHDSRVVHVESTGQDAYFEDPGELTKFDANWTNLLGGPSIRTRPEPRLAEAAGNSLTGQDGRVELPGGDTAEEGVPLIGGEGENRPVSRLRVPHDHPAVGQGRDADAAAAAVAPATDHVLRLGHTHLANDRADPAGERRVQRI
jgi:hypothetical protein